MKRKTEYISIIFGSMLVAFTVYNIHSQTFLTEGGEIGIELLLKHWFGISPTISAICMDFTFYIIGFFVLNNRFRLNAIVGTLTYAATYFCSI